MASLLALPCELSFQIIKILDIGDKIHLSATCKFDEASAASALVAVEAHGQYTNVIEFTCQCDLDDQPTTPSLPPAACKVLNGHLTLNIHTATLKFDFGLDVDRDVNNESRELLWIYFDDEEDANTVHKSELRKKWRALMNETWEALEASIFTSGYFTNTFYQFLNQLESAIIRIFGTEDKGSRDFLSNLNCIFFHYMKRLKHLYIRALDPLGLVTDEIPHIELMLIPEDLPLLQSLKLENCFVTLKDNKVPFMADKVDGRISDESAIRRICQRLQADPTLYLFQHGYLYLEEGSLGFNDNEDVKAI
ncbi:hypothetical protein GGI43DRAFT_426139 [Trichoderma evansii]